MVQGLNELERRWSAVPSRVRQNVQEALEKAAAGVISDMNKVKPLDDIQIAWTWGDAPKGSMVLGKMGGQDFGTMRITIYARGDTFNAAWFEHGTAPRFHKSGKYVGEIAAVPFFYPVWRVWRRRVRGRITRAINKALESA